MKYYRDNKGRFSEQPQYLMLIIRKDALNMKNHNGDILGGSTRIIVNSEFVVGMNDDGSNGKICGKVIKSRWCFGKDFFAKVKDSVS